MGQQSLSESESKSDSDSGSGEIEGSPIGNSNVGISEYEKRRMKTIEDNKKRMDALGLKKMATSLATSTSTSTSTSVVVNKNKGKPKMVVDEDEDYKPSDSDSDAELKKKLKALCSACGGGGFVSRILLYCACLYHQLTTYIALYHKRLKDPDLNLTKTKNTVKTSKKQKSSQKPKQDSLYVDDDETLLQAIALSLKDRAGFIDAKKSASQSSTAQLNPAQNERNRNSQTPEDAEKRKRKKVTGSRVQMKEDELIMYFYQFDEMGKGSITLRDIQRVAAAHDFTWSDKEMADMIRYFDSDGDGKLNLDDLGKIADRCNMMIH